MFNGERAVRALSGAVFLLAALTACTATIDSAPPPADSSVSAVPPGTGAGAASGVPSSEATPPGASNEDPAIVDDPGGARLDAKITLVRSGGVAGGMDTATVETDGTWSSTKGSTSNDGKLSPVAIAKLNGLLEDPGLDTPGEPSKLGEQCPDRIHWTLTVGSTEYRTNTCGEPPNEVFSQIVGMVADSTGI